MAEKTQVAKVSATDSNCRMREVYKTEVIPYLMISYFELGTCTNGIYD